MSHPLPHSPLQIGSTTLPGHTTLVMDGVLDGTTYLAVRDAVVKAALNTSPLVVVDVTALRAPSPSAWSVFTSARWLVVDWPDVPIGLVCSHDSGRQTLVRNGIARYVPIYGDVDAAIGAMAAEARPPRRRVRKAWPASPSAAASARGFARHWLKTWSLDEFASTASVVTTVLVENVLQHTESDPDVRLETDGATVTIAVADGSRVPACVHDEDAVLRAPRGLQMVHAVTKVWGNAVTEEGKVVWAVMGREHRL